MDPIDDQKALETLLAAMRRWEHAPPVELSLNPYEGWILLAGVQLLLRHPDLSPSMRGIFTRVGRRLQPLVCDTAEIGELAERGWDPEHDRPRDSAMEDAWRSLVVPATGLGRETKVIAMLLASHARNLQIPVDPPVLSALSGFSVATVQRCLNRLTDLELIVPVAPTATVPPGAPQTYRLAMPTDPAVLDLPEGS